MKHTKGPWAVRGGPQPLPWPGVNIKSDVWPISAGTGFGLELVAYAHTEEVAKLIAAAPELLEACQRLLPLATAYAHEVGVVPDKQPEIISAKAAIAKAEGNT